MRGYMVKLPDGTLDDESLVSDECDEARNVCEDVYASLKLRPWEKLEREGFQVVRVEIKEIPE